MAKCDVCGKGLHFGNNVSHSHRRSNHIWKANIKNVKCIINGTPKRLHVCTTCLKSGAVERAYSLSSYIVESIKKILLKDFFYCLCPFRTKAEYIT